MQYIKVKDTNFVRDPINKALINTDIVSLEEYKSSLNLVASKKGEINKLNTEIVELKSELSEIKNMLLQLLTK
jgi:BMFP domain-containing protein YqiC